MQDFKNFNKEKKQVLMVMPKVAYMYSDWPVPPIGIPYISSAMKKSGISVHCLNLSLCEERTGEVLEKVIRDNRIDIVATGDLVVNYQAVKEIVDCAKMISKDIITIIGGGLVTHSPEEAMQLIPNADYGVIGEGEVTDTELVLALEEGSDPREVAGIIYRSDSGLCRTAPRKAIEDLDELPWPDYEGFDYFEIVRREKNGENGVDFGLAAPLTTSRSCPFRCTFCSTSGGEKKYRQRSLDSIFAELKYLVEKYHVNEIFLNDELFAVNDERLHDFCKRIAPYHINWIVFLRLGKHIQPKILREMYDSGCTTIFYGLESANDTILKSMRKGTTRQEIFRVLKITKEAGLTAKGNFIFGDTQETLETAEDTMEWVWEHSDLLEDASFAPISLYPGSELYDRAIERKKIESPLQFIKEGCPLVNPSEQMDDETYLKLVNEIIPDFSARFRCKVAMYNMEKLDERITPERDKGQYRYEFYCERCKSRLVENLFPVDIYHHHTQCPHCGKRYKLYPSMTLFKQYEREFTNLLKEDGCVIWGMGQIAHDFYYNNAFFQKTAKMTLIDRNPDRQRRGFHGKQVWSPEVLHGRECNMLLCFVHEAPYYSIKRDLEEDDIHFAKVFLWNEILLKS